MIAQRYLNQKILDELGRHLGSNDIVKWIEERATQLSSQYWSEGEGMSLSTRFLETMRISQVKSAVIEGSASLRSGLNGYVVLVKSGLPVQTRRFAIAHEIGHTLFLDEKFSSKALSNLQWTIGRDPTIEHLCDRFAAALLIPLWRLRQSVENSLLDGIGDVPPFHLVETLSREYRVPEQAMFRRICYDLYGVKLVAVCLRQRKKNPSLARWLISWCCLPLELQMASQVDGVRIPLKTSGRVIPSVWLPNIRESDHTTYCKLDGRWWSAVRPVSLQESRKSFQTYGPMPDGSGFACVSGRRFFLGFPQDGLTAP
jgi:Zn-dependent peptidase ImmA (M78 family)